MDEKSIAYLHINVSIARRYLSEGEMEKRIGLGIENLIVHPRWAQREISGSYDLWSMRERVQPLATVAAALLEPTERRMGFTTIQTTAQHLYM